jgi:hypothetical protein
LAGGAVEGEYEADASAVGVRVAEVGVQAEHAAAERPVEEFMCEAEEDELLEDSGVGGAARGRRGRD